MDVCREVLRRLISRDVVVGARSGRKAETAARGRHAPRPPRRHGAAVVDRIIQHRARDAVGRREGHIGERRAAQA